MKEPIFANAKGAATAVKARKIPAKRLSFFSVKVVGILFLQFLHILQNLLNMFRWLYIFVNLGDFAFWVDEEGPTQDAHVFAAHEFLQRPNAVVIHGLLFFIRKKGEGQVEFI